MARYDNVMRVVAFALIGMAVAAGAQAAPAAAAPDCDAGSTHVVHREQGRASWYGEHRHGKKTANGQRMDRDALTAAHRRLPLGTRVKVTNLENGRAVVLTINDRGPYVRGRVIDVSRRAAEELGFRETGTARVRIETLPAAEIAAAC